MLETTQQESAIHPTAIIHPSAVIEENVSIGPYAVIGENVILGRGTTVGPHAVIEFSHIGQQCQIFPSAFVGTAPQDLKFSGEPSLLIMGNRTIVRECVTLHRGTAARGKTVIGHQCLFMAYSHVAHDCVIGDRVVVANSVAIAGHVEVESDCTIGGLCGIHQFVRIGRGAMLGGGAMVPLDVPPFCLAQGDRARLLGLNITGLRRQRVSSETLRALKSAYKTLFREKRSLQEAISALRSQPQPDEVEYLLRFIESSPRGILRPDSASTTEDE